MSLVSLAMAITADEWATLVHPESKRPLAFDDEVQAAAADFALTAYGDFGAVARTAPPEGAELHVVSGEQEALDVTNLLISTLARRRFETTRRAALN